MYDISGYYEAKDLQDIFKLSQQNPNAMLIAGGTDVLVKARFRMPDFVGKTLIGITRVKALRGVQLDTDGTVEIGALTTFTELETNPIINEHLPLLSQAVSLVGGPQTRNRGTVGGNICNAGPAADSAPSLFAYNAVCEVHSATGSRNVPIDQFYLGVGKVALKPGEVLVKLKIKQADYQGYVGYYIKFAQRMALDIANLGCAVLVRSADHTIADLRICFGAAAPTPIRMSAAEAYAKNKPITVETFNEIGQQCLKDTKTIEDWRASKAYRDHLVTVLPGRALRKALKGGTQA